MQKEIYAEDLAAMRVITGMSNYQNETTLPVLHCK